VDFCPNQLFTNTKSDLGACDKIHNDRLKDKYQKSDKSKYPYEAEFYDYLNKLISDLARKIRQGNGRLNVQSDERVRAKILCFVYTSLIKLCSYWKLERKKERKRWFYWM
jgi:hypothetical protein